jgi:hypothetical protein
MTATTGTGTGAVGGTTIGGEIGTGTGTGMEIGGGTTIDGEIGIVVMTRETALGIEIADKKTTSRVARKVRVAGSAQRTMVGAVGEMVGTASGPARTDLDLAADAEALIAQVRDLAVALQTPDPHGRHRGKRSHPGLRQHQRNWTTRKWMKRKRMTLWTTKRTRRSELRTFPT